MKVEVLFFAQLKEVLGTDREVIEVADRAVVQDVVQVLARRPEWRRVAEIPLSFAVNDAFVPGTHALAEGDRVAILTPVSGG